MKRRKHLVPVIMAAVAFFAEVASAAKSDNLFVNSAFASKSSVLPDSWNGLGGKSAQAYVTRDGVLEISNVTGVYANWVSQSVAIDETKTYYFEAEVRSDALSGGASVTYSVFNGNKRKIVADRPIVRNFSGPVREWRKFSAVIPIPSGEGAERLSVGFILYNPSRRPGSAEKISFRNPRLCEYTGQKTIALTASKKSAAAASMPDNPFSSNFTGEPIGSTYRLERNGVGFLRLNSGNMPKMPVTMNVDVPDGVEVELYLSKGGLADLVKIIPQAKGRYEIPRSVAWITWGNALVFRAGESAPAAFDIKLSFSACGKTVKYKVPVRVFDGGKSAALPAFRRFNSWQAFPVTRIDTANPSNILGRALFDYWKRAGWRHAPFVEVHPAFPARITPPVRALAEGDGRLCDVAVDAKGAPVNAWCDSDWVARDTSHYVERLRKTRFEQRIKDAQYVMWDYEPYNEGPVTCGCFCDRCRKLFAVQASLEQIPAGVEILAKHKAEWIKFRCRQRADVVRKVVNAVKAINPKVRFIFCTMPGDPGTDPEWMLKYGIDLSLYNDFVDIYATMNYSQGLDFFRSLEDERRVLKKETRMFISNGWGKENTPERTGLQLLGAFFGGIDYPFVGQGLYISQCDQIAAMRKAMNFIAETENRWGDAKCVLDGKLPLKPGFRSEKSVYSLERRSADGTRHVIVFNNSEREPAFARLSVPGEGDLTLSLRPLSWKYLELTARDRERRRIESEAAAAEEAEIAKKYEKLFETREANGIATSATPDLFTVKTPAQSISFGVRNNGRANWYAQGRLRADMIGRDYFTVDGMFTEPKTCSCTIERSEILDDRAEVTLSYRVENAPYDGLVVRRRYSIMRDVPRIDVSLEIVPEGGYRPFRLRTGANMRMAKEMPSPTDVSSIYICGGREYSGLKHVAFVRDGAKFPSQRPFFLGSRFLKETMPLKGSGCMVRDVSSGDTFDCRADAPDQIFGWRERKSASVEFIFADAYDRYDPHGIKTWKSSYSFELKKKGDE